MGGHQAGDIASQTTIDVIVKELAKLHPDMSIKEWEKSLVDAIENANSHIFAKASLNPELAGMGTTLVAALTTMNRLSIAHIGDSRAYLLHKGKLRQLTEDHSLVNELLKSGQITEEEASSHPRRNVLTRALGTENTVEADIRHTEWNHGDILLLCSDGLTNMIDEKAILHTLEETCSLERKADRLIELALQAGGDDNVTVVLVANDLTEKDRRASE